jgi:vacuolar-type H+-ATPase subunit F/Vma7/vacuolar-type H+-ATPase subunit E/Vma4
MDVVVVADELTAVGWRLAGARVAIASAADVEERFEQALASAELVMISAPLAARLPAPRLQAALQAFPPLTLIIAVSKDSISVLQGIVQAHPGAAGSRGAGTPGARGAAVSSPAPLSVLDAQVEAMLERVSQHRERRTGEIRSRAAAQKLEIVRGARAEARESLKRAVARERARMAQGLRQAEARAELESRRRAQLETRTLLKHMWEHVAEVLEQRWRGEAQRSEWIHAAVEEAVELLAGQSWRIEHAAGVSAEDRRRAESRARAGGARGIEWQLDGQLRAGLRVRSPGASLDATVVGLLARREEVEAAFLSEYRAVSTRHAPGNQPAGTPALSVEADRP